jgi:hypothetical protein
MGKEPDVLEESKDNKPCGHKTCGCKVRDVCYDTESVCLLWQPSKVIGT